jgi:hypothetical protein
LEFPLQRECGAGGGACVEVPRVAGEPVMPARRRVGAHRVRAKRGPMAGSSVTRHLRFMTADHDPPYGFLTQKIKIGDP